MSRNNFGGKRYHRVVLRQDTVPYRGYMPHEQSSPGEAAKGVSWYVTYRYLMLILCLGIMAEDQGIIEWYAGRTLFITGGTGFMGKVLLEKLLRVCPEIRRIYILCRAKRGFSPVARISEITKIPVRTITFYFIFFTLALLTLLPSNFFWVILSVYVFESNEENCSFVSLCYLDR